MGKKIVIAAAALLLAGAVAALAVFVLVPAGKLARANKLLDQGDAAGAFDAYDRMGDYGDAAGRKAQVQADVIASRSAESLTFGGREWLVLEERNGRALLLLKNILELRPYNETLEASAWESCTLRAYLNAAFYASIPEADRGRVVSAQVRNSGSAAYGTKAGGDTEDHVFLLSLAQAKLYFAGDAARVAYGANGAAYWWLRSPGMEPIVAATVGSDGALGEAGSAVNAKTRGVRPAIWAIME